MDRKAVIEPKKLALHIVGVAKSKKAHDVLVLDMRGVCNFSDYFVIMSAGSLRQVNAISQAVEEDLNRKKIKPFFSVSGNDETGWVVLDFSSVIVHIFYEPKREFYALERLWQDAKKVAIPRRFLKS